jgi:putative ABC transport system substrate-binding protein
MMKRRDLIVLLGGAATWPLAARAQADVPAVGYLSSFSPEANRKFTEAFREALNEAGFQEGRNVNIEYRWAEEGRYETLPKMAAELANRRVSVIFASPIPAALAAKATTATIPIVFAVGSDPVETGLVTSLNRPGGNATGATFLSVELGSKRLELLRDLAPKIASVGLLVNPHNPNAAPQSKEMEEATKALGLRSIFLKPALKAILTACFVRYDNGTTRLWLAPIHFSSTIAASSLGWQSNMRFPPFTMRVSSFRRVASSVMRPASTTPFAEPRPTWRAS